MKVYEPPSGSPDTALMDNWPPSGEFCRTDAEEYCVQYDKHDWITDNKNWCFKHESQCQLDAGGRPMKCMKCQLDLPGKQPANLSRENGV